MLRIHESATKLIDGKLHYGGGLFTGRLFRTHAMTVSEVRTIEAGVDVGAHDEDFAGRLKGAQYVHEERGDFEAFEDHLPVTMGGRPFTGVFCEFERGSCVREASCEEGRVQREVCWYANGQMEALTCVHEPAAARYELDAHGRIEVAWASAGPQKRWDCTFEAGRLKTLIVNGNPFAEFPAHFFELPLRWGLREEDFRGLELAESVSVRGDANALRLLADGPDAESVARLTALTVVCEGVKARQLEEFLAAPRLERVRVRSRDPEVEELLDRTEAARPKLVIERE